MDTKSLRKALNDGEPIDVGALLDFIERLQSVLQKAEAKTLELEKKVEKLSGSVRLEAPYSISAEEKRQQERDRRRVAKLATKLSSKNLVAGPMTRNSRLRSGSSA